MLPNPERAFVAPNKVRDYLLSPSHPVGRFKATVFVALGYTQENWERLRDDLLTIARTGSASTGQLAHSGRRSRSVVFWSGLLAEAANSQLYGWCELAKTFPGS